MLEGGLAFLVSFANSDVLLEGTGGVTCALSIGVVCSQIWCWVQWRKVPDVDLLVMVFGV